MSFFVYGGSVKNTIQVFETKSKYNNAHPNFNEEFVLQTTGDWKKIDIQISIKVITSCTSIISHVIEMRRLVVFRLENALKMAHSSCYRSFFSLDLKRCISRIIP